MAIEKVKFKEMEYLKASLMHCVPKSTLERTVKGINKVFKGNEKGLGSRNKTFPPEIENNLVKYIQKIEGMFYGLTTQDVRSLEFQLAEKNKLPHYFSNEKKKALEKYSLKAVWDRTN